MLPLGRRKSARLPHSPSKLKKQRDENKREREEEEEGRKEKKKKSVVLAVWVGNQPDGSLPSSSRLGRPRSRRLSRAWSVSMRLRDAVGGRDGQ